MAILEKHAPMVVNHLMEEKGASENPFDDLV